MYYKHQMPSMQNYQIPLPPECENGTIYIVRPGDTLFRIANRYGTALHLLMQANPQIPNPNIIFLGQQICIPDEITPIPPEEFCPSERIYIAQKGDSLFSIANKYGLTVKEIIDANPQIADPNLIETGSRICIPTPGVSLPEGTSKICLVPCLEGVLGGTVYIDSIGKTICVATFGLPNIEEIEGDYCIYWVWVYNSKLESYTKIELKDSGVKEIHVGSGKIACDNSEKVDVFVTAEPLNITDKPSGPILMRRGF
ncbi:MAG: LysM peptidoglycan-binding domain-containing protein [Alkaliphilus sp.]